MYTNNTDEQRLANSSTQQMKHWRPKLVSGHTVVFGGLGLLNLALFGLITVFNMNDISIPDILTPITEHRTEYAIWGIFWILLAMAIETVSRLRTPPPVWRVKQELIRALGDMGLLELNNMDMWKGKFAVSPIGTWNKQAKCFTVPFLLRNVNATEDKFKTMEKSIAGFARSLDCSIEQDNSKRLYNFKLILWYDNPYANIDNINPFN